MADAKRPAAAGPEPLQYVPGKTLGRSGFVDDPESRLATRIAHLDALLCVLAGEEDDDGKTDFRRLNGQIQQTALDLASDLATEIHELHTQVTIAASQRRHGRELKGLARG